MKRIWIMRHGKSDRSHQYANDFERPLNERGRHDSSLIGQWIRDTATHPERVISSPAHRAEQTAELVVKASDFKGKIDWWDTLYPGDIESTLDGLQGLSEKLDHVLLIGHNPHLEDLASCLCSEGNLNLRLPTAALVLLEAETGSWRSLSSGGAELRGLITPKLLGR